ncbi:efflux RND transporter periplasmic adaptor subunit [Xanthomonas citri pv. bilvae]|uniref:efflux RND transporter periplasmic adaptor subunit n=1 Tax=Xanthomonas citri TaxID=346 RepID=UPI000541BD4B|nr:Acriflavine resistance protein A [Xanthomonas citri pv. bilvae]
MLPVAAHRFRTASLRWLLPAAVTTLMAACSSRQTLKVQRLAVDQTLSGRTVAYVTSDVRPQVGGIVRKRLFTEGQDVQAGQVLYEIDPASYQAAYDTAKGDLAQAEAAVLSARPKAQRYQTLVGLDAVSKQDGDDALATLRSNEAAVVAAKASLQTARINLDYTRITAPVSGRIGTSSYTSGALVSAGQSEVLATINQLDPIYVDVTQSSAQLLQLRRQLDAGQLKAVDGKAEVTLQLEGGSTYAHSGTLEVVDAAVDTATGTVKLRAVVPNPERLLLPGMYVTAKLSMAVDEQAILVPQQAISRNSKGQAVALVVGSDNKVAQRVLTTGDAIGDKWVVRQGLKAGDKVIVQGLQKASVGAEVKAVEVSQNAAAGTAANASPSTQGAAAAAPKAD